MARTSPRRRYIGGRKYQTYRWREKKEGEQPEFRGGVSSACVWATGEPPASRPNAATLNGSITGIDRYGPLESCQTHAPCLMPFADTFGSDVLLWVEDGHPAK